MVIRVGGASGLRCDVPRAGAGVEYSRKSREVANAIANAQGLKNRTKSYYRPVKCGM